MQFNVEQPAPEPIQHEVAVDPTASVPLPSNVAAERANRAKIGMPWFSKSYDEIFADLQTGMDNRLRMQASAEADWKAEAEKQDAILSVVGKLNRPLTKREEEEVRAVITTRNAKSPTSVFEEYYSREFMDSVARTGDENGWLKEFKRQDPSKVRDIFGMGTEYSTRQSMIRTAMEDGEQVAKEQSWLGWGVDRAKELFPFYWNLKMRGNVPGMSGLENLGTGTQIAEEAKALFRMESREAFWTAFTTKYKQLQNDNPALAQDWARAILGQSTSEEALNNVFGVFDVPALFGGAKLAIRTSGVIKSIRQTNEAVKSALKYVETHPNSSRAVIDEAAGNVEQGVVQRATTDIVNEMAGNPPVPESAVTRNLPSMYNRAIDNIRSNPGRLSTEGMNRIIERYQETASALVEAITKGIKIERLPAVMATERAIKGITNALKDEYPELRNNILDIKLRWDDKANVYFADYYLGKNGLALFDSESSAKRWVSEQGLSKVATISKEGVAESQQGVKWYVGVVKPLKEDSNVVRDALLATEHTKTPNSWLSSYAGWLGTVRTPEETLSLEQRFGRKIATYAPAWLRKVAEESAKEITELKAGRWIPGSKRRERWLEWRRVAEDSVDRSRRTGTLYENPLELDAAYQRVVGRLPDEQEIAAYFAWKRSHEMDWTLRNYQAFKELSRTGAMTHTVTTWDVARTAANGNIPSKNITFNAHRLYEIPNTDDVVVVLKDTVDDSFAQQARKIFGDTKNRYNEDIKEGKKILLEISNPSEHPFRDLKEGMENVHARYVLVDKQAKPSGKGLTSTHSEAPLDWMQVKRHAPVYEYNHYAKQAILKRDPITGKVWYSGDRVIAGFNLNAMGRDVVKKLEQVRLKLRDGDEAGARAYLKANPIGMDFDDIHKWFKGDVTSEGLPIPPRLDLGESIVMVPRNKTILQQEGKALEARVGSDAFKDGTREGYGRFFPQGVDTADIMSLSNEGSSANPLYKNNPVTHLDPVTHINRALNKSINDVYMNDYKIASVEHWLEEAKNFLKPSEADIRAAPYFHFFNPDWIDAGGEGVKTINNLKASQFQIRQLLGIRNEHETWLHSATQKLADSVYNKTGSQKIAEKIPAWLLPATRDPAGFIRGIAFHEKLGLFNPATLLVNLQSFVTIAGIAGMAYAGPGMKATLLSRYAGVNASREILEALDKIASKQVMPGTKAFRPGEFKEAWELLKTTGFRHVGGEYAARDNPVGVDIIKSGAGTFLDMGTFFFRESERAVREGAWFTAFKEYRDKNPFGKIGNREKSQILERADILYTNMSRASSSSLHTGILSIPTQFLAYQLRLTELFLGKRLTQQEKMRLFGTYSVMYGVPTAFGVTGFPLADYIRKWNQEGGGVIGDKWYDDVFSRGVPSLILALATGKGDYQKGNQYNISERYGPQGFGDFFRSDESFWKIISGPAGQTIYDSIAGLDGFTKVMKAKLSGQDADLKIEDFIEPFQAISSVNSARRLWLALNTGQWMSKKEVYQTDASRSNAIFMTLTGLSPQAISDVYTMKWTRDQEKDTHRAAEAYFTKELQRALRTAKTDPTQAKDYFNRAFAALEVSGYPVEDRPKVLARAMRGYESMVDKVTWDYISRDVNEKRKPVVRDAAPRILQNRQ